ncbi:hypothetical protein Ancab_000714 [Ancistrocladus abbreviatus]
MKNLVYGQRTFLVIKNIQLQIQAAPHAKAKVGQLECRTSNKSPVEAEFLQRQYLCKDHIR